MLIFHFLTELYNIIYVLYTICSGDAFTWGKLLLNCVKYIVMVLVLLKHLVFAGLDVLTYFWILFACKMFWMTETLKDQGASYI